MLCGVFLLAFMLMYPATADIESFIMARDPPYNITEIYIGGKNSVTLTVTFIAGTVSNVIIAIIPSTVSTILAVSKVNNFTLGSALSMTGLQETVNKYGLEYIDNTKVKYLSRVTFNIGNVTVSGTPSIVAERQIQINFELTMVSAGNLSNGTNYWASGGIGYKGDNNSQTVDICQLKYVLHNTSMKQNERDSEHDVFVGDVNSLLKFSYKPITPKLTPNKAIQGSTVVSELMSLSTLELGKQTKVNITISIPYPAFNLTLETYTNATYGEVVPTQLDVVDAGEAFKSFLQFNSLKTNGYTSCMPNTTLVLEIPGLVNKESTVGGANPERDKITLVVGYQTKYDPALVGRRYIVGLRVNVGTDVSITKYSTIQISNRVSTDSLAVPIITYVYSASVLAGYPAVIYMEIPVPPNSNKTYEIKANSEPVTAGKQPALSILAIKPLSYGSNLPCPLTGEDVSITTNSTGTTTPSTMTHFITAFRLLNSGVADDPQANILKVAVTVLLMKRTDVVTGNQHNLTIKVTVEGGTNVNKSITFTVAGTTPDTTFVGHTLALSRNCPMNKSIQGSFVSLNVTVTTAPGIVSGPMLIEAAVVPIDTTNIFSFCGAKVVFAGENVLCLTAGTILSYTNVDGTNNRVALITIPYVCNFNIYSAKQSNDFIVEITSKLDETYVAQNYSVGIYINYSATQYWMSRHTTFVESSTTILGNGGMYAITGLYVNIPDLAGNNWPGPYRLQYQIGQDFITVPDRPGLWKMGTSNSTWQKYSMNVPVFANVSRLRTVNCRGGCYVTLSFLTKSASEFIHVWGDNSGSLLLKLNTVFDGDNTTCFQVPIVGQDSPPVLWFKIINLSLINISAAPFRISIVGQNIVCDRESRPKTMYVAFPDSVALTNTFYGGLRFCTATTAASGTECVLTCNCPSPDLCAEIIFFFWNDGDTIRPSTLCEIRAVNT